VYTQVAECELRREVKAAATNSPRPTGSTGLDLALGNRKLRDRRTRRSLHTSNTERSLSGHSTKTAVVTSRLAIADIAHLHTAAERADTTVSALVARIVHEHAPQLDQYTTGDQAELLGQTR
jgi:hypothetical protein